MYCFLKATLPSGTVMYLKDPLTIAPGTDPYKVIIGNKEFFMNLVTNNLLETLKPGENPFQDFADENASQWSKPSTYGNMVWDFDVIKGKFTSYKA